MRRIFYAILLTLLLLFVPGCGKTPGETEGNTAIGINPEKIGSLNAPEQADQVKAPSWNVSRRELDAEYEIASINNGRIYGCSYIKGGLLVAVSDVWTGELLVSYQIPGVTEIQDITVDYQDQICLFGTDERGSALWKLTREGEVKNIEVPELQDLGLLPSFQGFYADPCGFYYLWYRMMASGSETVNGYSAEVYCDVDRIYVMDRDLNVVCCDEVTKGDTMVCLLFDEEGRPMLLARDFDGYYICQVSTEEGKEYEKYYLNGVDLYELDADTSPALTSGGLLFLKDGAVHMYHLEEGWDETMMELAAGGIYAEDVICLEMREGCLEIIDNFRGSEKSEYSRFEQGGQMDQIAVTLGVLQMTTGMRDLIASFNRSQNRIRIEPVIYTKGCDYNTGFEKLKLDIIQNKAPDMFSTAEMDLEILANAGALADIYGFMDQDPECGRETLVSSVLKAYEINGGLYSLSPDFYVFTMWGGESVVKGRNGVTMEELMEILKENGGDVNSIYGFSADESVLRTLCTLGMDEFIDWEKRTCDFTGDGFRDVLEFAREYQGKQFDSLYRAIRDGEVLMTLMSVSSVEDCRLWSEIYGEDIQYIGCPTAEGTGSALYMGEQLAVSARTEHSAEAWEILKYFLLHGYERIGTGFPLVRGQFENFLENSLTEETALDELGNPYRIPRKRFSERDTTEIEIYKAEPRDVEAVREMIENATKKYEYSNEVLIIIEEGAEGYFKGQKTIDDVTRIIQNRVQLYLNEQG